MTTRDEMLQREAEHAEELDALFARVTGRWDEAGATGDWTPRDVLAHIAAWHDIATQWFADLASTVETDAPWAPPWGDDLDGFNETLHEKSAGIPVDAVRADAKRARAAFVEALRALPDELSDRHVRVATGNGHGHYGEHIPGLTAFVENA